MNNRTGREALPRQGKRHGSACMRFVERRLNVRVCIRRTETHNDIFGTHNRFEPGGKKNRQIECRQSAFSHDHRMNEFDRDMLSVRRIGSSSEREEAAALEEPVVDYLSAGPVSHCR